MISHFIITQTPSHTTTLNYLPDSQNFVNPDAWRMPTTPYTVAPNCLPDSQNSVNPDAWIMHSVNPDAWRTNSVNPDAWRMVRHSIIVWVTCCSANYPLYSYSQLPSGFTELCESRCLDNAALNYLPDSRNSVNPDAWTTVSHFIHSNILLLNHLPDPGSCMNPERRWDLPCSNYVPGLTESLESAKQK
ncbi:hypothetical protein BD779DRAFT_1477299 [Infundibulicybe gibba]|nr:hypothetical protein BD779DRAFT_1477299 [Infundibulicybe gibba]